jgi:hypothetical protein
VAKSEVGGMAVAVQRCVCGGDLVGKWGGCTGEWELVPCAFAMGWMSGGGGGRI